MTEQERQEIVDIFIDVLTTMGASVENQEEVTSYPSVTLVATDFGNGVYKWVAIQWQKETA